MNWSNNLEKHLYNKNFSISLTYSWRIKTIPQLLVDVFQKHHHKEEKGWKTGKVKAKADYFWFGGFTARLRLFTDIFHQNGFIAE